jgi:hypothetical protein
MAEWVDYSGDILEAEPVRTTAHGDLFCLFAPTEVYLDRVQVRELVEHLQQWAGPDDEPDCATGPGVFALLGLALAGIWIVIIAVALVTDHL